MNNNQPWICPRCTQVNAPWVPFCCKENKDQFQISTTQKIGAIPIHNEIKLNTDMNQKTVYGPMRNDDRGNQ